MQLNGIKFVAALMATLKFFLSLLLLFVCFLLVPFFFHYYTLLSPSFTFSVSLFISCLMEPDITLLRHSEKKIFEIKRFVYVHAKVSLHFRLENY